MSDVNRYIIVEPHMQRTKNNLMSGQNRSVFISGTIKDDEISLLEEISKNQSKILLIDLFPYCRLGSGRIEILKNLFNDKKIYFILRKDTFEDEFKNYNLPYLLFDENFKLIEKSFANIEINQNYKKFKLKYIEAKLLEWVKDAIVTQPGNRWITLQDGTKANKWIDIKGLVRKPERLFYLAYQIGYLLSKGYIDIELKEIDGFIVSNNNALSIASLLSIFFNKQLFIIDKLGPSPRINPDWLNEMREKLNGKKLIIIEDVISTGREVDLLYFFLIYHRVEVKLVISIIDLNCAHPVLLQQNKILSLCKPSVKLGYKRILAYQDKEQ